MKPRFNFAPVSSAQSGLLRFAASWFIFNGVVYGLLVVAVIVRLVVIPQLPARTTVVVFSVAIQAIAAGGIIWTGSLLARGMRLGGFLAIGFVLLPIVFAAFTRQPLDIFQIAFAVLGAIVLVVIWHELK